MGAIDLLHAAFLKRECVRLEDRAAVVLVLADDLVQALLDVKRTIGSPRQAICPSKRTKLEVRHDLVAEALVHVQRTAGH